MPSRNSVNKPKDTLSQARKHAKVSKKRAERVRKGLVAPPRSAASSTSGLPKSTAVALFTGSKPAGTLTTHTLSNKRMKKIVRNQKYVAKRREELLMIDVQANVDQDMEIDEDVEPVVESKINSVKNALWSVIEDGSSAGLALNVTTGDGTTLGGPSF